MSSAEAAAARAGGAQEPASLKSDNRKRKYSDALEEEDRDVTVVVGDETFEVTPDKWKGSRDRSWGIRPVGEFEPPGIHAGIPTMAGMWNYCPMQFEDYSILYICHENNNGHRELEEAVRVWHDPEKEFDYLGRPEHEHTKNPETGFIDKGFVSFPDAPGGALNVEITPMTHVYVMVGTGYGLEPDWKHGMYKGKLCVENLTLDMNADKDRMFGLCDNAANVVVNGGDVGYGLFEWGFFGPFERYGFE